MAKLQTTTKPASKTNATKATKATTGATKATTKANPTTKAVQAPKAPTVPYFAALLIKAMAGDMGKMVKAYYQTAAKYHETKGTIFPRAKTATVRANMTQAMVDAVLDRAAKGILASGAMEGQAVYDLMRIGADKPAK